MNNLTNAKASPEIDGAAMAVLTEHRSGQVMSDLSEAIRKVAGAVVTIGKPGKVILEFTLRPAQSAAGTLVITDEISCKVPKTTPRGSIFYADEQNNLVRNDPAQADLPLRIIDNQPEPMTAAELKHV